MCKAKTVTACQDHPFVSASTVRESHVRAVFEALTCARQRQDWNHVAQDSGIGGGLSRPAESGRSPAETYRETRAGILHRYRSETRVAQQRLEAASEHDGAWQDYLDATESAREKAHAALEKARRDFRETVALARG